jgi:putative transposase
VGSRFAALRRDAGSWSYLRSTGCHRQSGVRADFETGLAEFNGESNHVHLLVNFPPKVALSRLVNSLKGVSSRRMRQEFPDLARHYWRANRLWSGSYFAGSVGGAPISVLRQYIEQQNRPA